MIKSIVQCFILVLILLTFCFCTTTTTSTINDSVNLSSNNQIDPQQINVQYIRTQYRGGGSSPVIAIISSVNELGDYGIFDISGRSTDTLRSYTAGFFADNFLIIIFVQESSGSIRHDVQSIDEHGIIVINRLIPEIGTSDMAAWNIIIERNKRFMLNDFKAEFVNVHPGLLSKIF